MREFILALVPVLLLTFAPAVSHAGDILGIDRHKFVEPFEAPLVVPPYTPVRKLGNGLWNVGLGWVEIPFQVGNETLKALHADRNPLVGSLVGVVYGLGFTIARMTTGVFEIPTFWIHFSFEPIMTPETVYGLKYVED